MSLYTLLHYHSIILLYCTIYIYIYIYIWSPGTELVGGKLTAAISGRETWALQYYTFSTALAGISSALQEKGVSTILVKDPERLQGI